MATRSCYANEAQVSSSLDTLLKEWRTAAPEPLSAEDDCKKLRARKDETLLGGNNDD